MITDEWVGEISLFETQMGADGTRIDADDFENFRRDLRITNADLQLR
jgi:hypothetical protein